MIGPDQPPETADGNNSGSGCFPTDYGWVDARPPEHERVTFDGELHALPPESVRLEILTSAIFTSVVSLLTVGGLALSAVFGWIWGWWWLLAIGAAVALIGLLIWSTFVWPRWEHERLRYAIGPRGLQIRRGVVWRTITHVACSRVQHVDVAQGPFQRQFGLATLHVFTAGTSNNQIDLSGLRHATALRMRDYLVEESPHDDH